jgi:hypothetical protein
MFDTSRCPVGAVGSTEGLSISGAAGGTRLRPIEPDGYRGHSQPNVPAVRSA